MKKLVLFLLTACSSHPNVVSTELTPFYDSFLQEAELRGIKLNTENLQVLMVDQLEKEYIGVCRVSNKGQSVEILRSFWEKAVYNDKLMLMYHELGHCLCELDHVDNYTNIMNTYLPFHFEYKPFMIDDLFTRCAESLKD